MNEKIIEYKVRGINEKYGKSNKNDKNDRLTLR